MGDNDRERMCWKQRHESKVRIILEVTNKKYEPPDRNAQIEFIATQTEKSRESENLREK